MTEFQAAVLNEQMKRLRGQIKTRDRNAIYLNKALSQIPGIIPMKRDRRATVQSYFNFTFRFKRREFKDLPVEQFRKALAAELGTGVEPCYAPLNDCPLYRPHTKRRYNISRTHWKRIDPGRFRLKRSWTAFTEESVCMHHSVLLGSRKDMDLIVQAIVKISENVDELVS